MESLYLLIPLSIAVVFFALWIFFKAMDSGQFDDLEGPALRILQDDDRTPAEPAPTESNSKK
jgi:cbb3-type cytochrome oxidase maturation protein